MKIASIIFAITGASWLIWMAQRILDTGFHIGAALVIFVPLVLLFQAWQLWTNRPNARRAGIATAAVFALGCAAELWLIWYVDIPINLVRSSPLQAMLVSLWSGVVLYCVAVISLMFRPSDGPNNPPQRTRSEQHASQR